MKLTVDKIDLLKDKKFITHVIPSDDILEHYDTVDALKIAKLVTLTDPTEVIEESIKTDEDKYLIFTALEDGTIGWQGNDGSRIIQYSGDKGETWNDWEVKTNIDVVAGDVIYIKGNYASYTQNFTSTCRFAASGTINALLGDHEMEVRAFQNMFRGCTGLTTAPTLPATTLATGCYSYMFYGCTGLTTAPALPATTLATGCYQNMFSGCTSLTTVPELPATTLSDNCYLSMFSSCTSLATAPELPATTLAENCYQSMFQGCTSLTTAPALPATTLADGCYGSMFYSCTSLATVPEISATTLVDYCYQYMFTGCISLNYIKCLATDASATDCLNNWTMNVSSTGTFVKAAGVEWPTGTSGIPSGWTVEEV